MCSLIVIQGARLGIFYYIDTDAFDLKKKELILTYVVYCQLFCSFANIFSMKCENLYR